MERHTENAMALATWLNEHLKVAHVSYPGLAGDPYNAAARNTDQGAWAAC